MQHGFVERFIRRLPGPLFFGTGIGLGVLAAFVILFVVQLDSRDAKLTPRAPAKVVTEAPRPVVVARPLTAVTRAEESVPARRAVVRQPPRRAAVSAPRATSFLATKIGG